MPRVSLPPAHPARKSSAMARPREPPESYYSYGPWAVGAPTVRQAWSGWRLGDDSKESAPPASSTRGITSRRAPRPAGRSPRCRTQPMGTPGTDNTPRSGCRRQILLVGRSWRVWPRAQWAGVSWGAADKDCASRARPRGPEQGLCSGYTASWSR